MQAEVWVCLLNKARPLLKHHLFVLRQSTANASLNQTIGRAILIFIPYVVSAASKECAHVALAEWLSTPPANQLSFHRICDTQRSSHQSDLSRWYLLQSTFSPPHARSPKWQASHPQKKSMYPLQDGYHLDLVHERFCQSSGGV